MYIKFSGWMSGGFSGNRDGIMSTQQKNKEKQITGIGRGSFMV
jgi:hypothetical protein